MDFLFYDEVFNTCKNRKIYQTSLWEVFPTLFCMKNITSYLTV